jgi:hypothetical protein
MFRRAIPVESILVVIVSILGSLLVASITANAQLKGHQEQARLSVQAELQQRTNEKKREAYFSFLDIFRDVIWQSKADADKTEINQKMGEIMTTFLLTASDEVVNTFLKWRDASQKQDGTFSVLAEFAALLRAMRQDLGYSTTDLSERQILASFINDLDKQYDFLELLKEREKQEPSNQGLRFDAVFEAEEEPRENISEAIELWLESARV